MIFVTSNSSCSESDESSSDEFRPPPGSMLKAVVKTQSKTHRPMSLRSSPRKQPHQQLQQTRSSPRKLPKNSSDGLRIQSKETLNCLTSSSLLTSSTRQSPRKKGSGGVEIISKSPLNQANDQQTQSLDKKSPTKHHKLQRQNAIVKKHRSKSAGKQTQSTFKSVKKDPPKWSSEDEDIDSDEDDVFYLANEGEEKKSKCESSEEEKKLKEPKSGSKQQLKSKDKMRKIHQQKQILEEQPLMKKKRGRPKLLTFNGAPHPREAKDIPSSAVGRKRLYFSSPSDIKHHKQPRVAFNNYSNPFDESALTNRTAEYETPPEMGRYQRKMRDLLELERYLGRPDCRGFCRRPHHRPFLMRNLFYIQNQQRPRQRISTDQSMGSSRCGRKHSMLGMDKSDRERSSSCSSTDKMPATIKFKLIRNNNCFGNKSAIIQCFHASETNGRLSQLKRIPSATFEKPINEKINTFIDIDMLEECQLASVQQADNGNASRTEHFVVRIVFRFEDAEIGGHHLRKVSGRQPSVDSGNKILRKNGPAESKEMVMFGCVRIFEYSPEQGLCTTTGEASILLHSASELHVDDLNTKSSIGQVARLINAANNNSAEDIPFIRICVLNEDDEDSDEEEDSEDEKDYLKEGVEERGGRSHEMGGKSRLNRVNQRRQQGISQQGQGRNEEQQQLLIERTKDKLLELEAATAAASLAAGITELGTGNGRRSMGGQSKEEMQKKLMELPEKIALKFPLHQMPLPWSRPYQLNAIANSPDGQPTLKRAKLGCSSDSSETMEEGEEEDQTLTQGSFNSGSSSIGLPNGLTDPSAINAHQPKQQPEFALRLISPTTCFMCQTRLPLRNLWTLLTHFRFAHPRFEFIYEPSIAVDHFKFPGFSITLNPHFDASFELQPLRHGLASSGFSRADAFPSNMSKKPISSRPVWLITKSLAQKMRANEDFPIERFTAFSQQQGSWGESGEYLRTLGRFSFETPTRLDQQWLVQTGSRKLEEITDLHPAERQMMQLWNAFLPRIRITMLGHKMAYKATRVFVRHHRRQIDQMKLRTHFLLLLSTLLNSNAIDDEERYDLMMRLEPGYEPQRDAGHFVARELVLLEQERLLGQKGGQLQGQQQQQLEVTTDDINKRGAAGQQQQKGQKTGSGDFGSSPDRNKLHGRRHQKPQLQAQQQSTATIEYKTVTELRARYPFASNKRVENIWKFVRQYDYHNFKTLISTSTAAAPPVGLLATEAAAPSVSVPATFSNNRKHSRTKSHH